MIPKPPRERSSACSSRRLNTTLRRRPAHDPPSRVRKWEKLNVEFSTLDVLNELEDTRKAATLEAQADRIRQKRDRDLNTR